MMQAMGFYQTKWEVSLVAVRMKLLSHSGQITEPSDSSTSIVRQIDLYKTICFPMSFNAKMALSYIEHLSQVAKYSIEIRQDQFLDFLKLLAISMKA